MQEGEVQFVQMNFLKSIMSKKRVIDNQLKDELLVFGYIKKRNKQFCIIMPQDLIEIVLMFYMQIHEILKWSRKYIGKLSKYHHLHSNGPTSWIEYSDNDKCVSKKNKYDGNFYVLADVEPVSDKIHCWRVYVKLNL